jgi:hypothetical protein
MNDLVDDVEIDEERAEALLRARRARVALSLAPELAEHLRSLLTPSDGRTERGERPTDRTPLLTGVDDDADELYVGLLEWVDFWADALQLVKPTRGVLAWRNLQVSHRSAGYRDGQLLGFRAGTSPRVARTLVQSLSSWLLRIDERRLEGHWSTREFQDHVTWQVWSLRAASGLTAARPAREASDRPCPVCKTFSMRAEFFGGTVGAAELRGELDVAGVATRDERLDPTSPAGRRILSAVDGVAVRCSYCGHVVKPTAGTIAGWLS